MAKASETNAYSVVIVEYFSGSHILDCLASLSAQTHVPEVTVIVINGIEETYRQKIEEDFPSIQLVDPHENLGYSRAANLGIATTDTPIVVTLNPDTVLEPDAAEIACEYLVAHNDVGAVGPQIHESNGDIYPSARSEPNMLDAVGHAVLGQFFPRNNFSRRYKNLDVDPHKVRNADWLSGAVLFLRRDALNDIGGWDERFFMYCEDIDLGRSMRMFRWKNTYVPDSHVTHIQGVSTSRTPIPLLFQHHKSLYLYAAKKYSRNPVLKLLVGFFVVIRFPLSLIAHIFRID